MSDLAPDRLLRDARALLAFQHTLIGSRTRFLDGRAVPRDAAPVPSPAPARPTPGTAPAETALAGTAPAGTAPAGTKAAPAGTSPPPPASLPAGVAPAPPSPDRPSSDAPMPPDLFGAPAEADDARSPYERVEALIPDGSPLRAMTSLEQIRDWLAQTVLVPIDRDRLNPVLGTGDPHADLMVIGEAPGADEDRQGEPFVGRAGQLLNKILEAILFRREEVYITNILKTRPPGNRDPEPEEVAAHLPILYKQIALVRPKLLLAVGRTAGNGLLGRASAMGALRGRFHDFHGLPLMVTYHPAALLRNPQWKRPTWEDVKLLRTRYDQLRAA